MPTIGQMMAMEYEHEAKATRSHLERLPALDYKPHDKSMTAGALASHLCNINEWVEPTVDLDVLEMSSDEKQWSGNSKDEILAKFDESLKKALAKLAAVPDDKMMTMWSMKIDGHEILSMPRVAVLRGFILSHAVHHRAQLGVYLRLNNIAVPSSYGPSADEGQMGGG